MQVGIEMAKKCLTLFILKVSSYSLQEDQVSLSKTCLCWRQLNPEGADDVWHKVVIRFPDIQSLSGTHTHTHLCLVFLKLFLYSLFCCLKLCNLPLCCLGCWFGEKKETKVEVNEKQIKMQITVELRKWKKLHIELSKGNLASRNYLWFSLCVLNLSFLFICS